MKRIIFLVFVLSIAIKGISQITVLSNGNVGIGNTSPVYKLDVGGDISGGSQSWNNWTSAYLDFSYECCGSPVLYPSRPWYLQLGKSNQRIGTIWVSTLHYLDGGKESDVRLKENIKKISGIRNELFKIQSVSYNYKKDQFNSFPEHVQKRLTISQIGFIAQDVEKVFPSLVLNDDSADIKAVDYAGFVPLILQAMKEQDSIILSQNEQIKELQKLVANNKQKSAPMEQSANNSMAYLEQNSPNPFNVMTQINYYLPDEAQKAALYVYDMNGIQIKTIPINQKGKGNISIHASELRPGMYLYSLIVDGAEIDTKRMILTE